jgi:hypothetical protein
MWRLYRPPRLRFGRAHTVVPALTSYPSIGREMVMRFSYQRED